MPSASEANYTRYMCVHVHAYNCGELCGQFVGGFSSQARANVEFSYRGTEVRVSGDRGKMNNDEAAKK